MHTMSKQCRPRVHELESIKTITCLVLTASMTAAATSSGWIIIEVSMPFGGISVFTMPVGPHIPCCQPATQGFAHVPLSEMYIHKSHTDT